VVQNMPDLWEENILTHRAFWDLNPERYTAMGEGVIPYLTIRTYARDLGLPVLETLRRLRVMDKAYLKHQDEERKREAKENERRQRNAKRTRVPRGR
jgi:hypothetical protein